MWFLFILCGDYALYYLYPVNNYDTFTAAITKEDFFPQNLTIEVLPTVHGPGDTHCFSILAAQDVFVEHEECFEFGISVPNSVTDRFMVELEEGKDTAEVCIEDNDRKSFYITLWKILK